MLGPLGTVALVSPGGSTAGGRRACAQPGHGHILSVLPKQIQTLCCFASKGGKTSRGLCCPHSSLSSALRCDETFPALFGDGVMLLIRVKGGSETQSCVGPAPQRRFLPAQPHLHGRKSLPRLGRAGSRRPDLTPISPSPRAPRRMRSAWMRFCRLLPVMATQRSAPIHSPQPTLCSATETSLTAARDAAKKKRGFVEGKGKCAGFCVWLWEQRRDGAVRAATLWRGPRILSLVAPPSPSP